jgi:general secretion pathway protein K
MVWQQWRAVQVEAGERARMQAAWILGGAIDWARLILREDARNGGVDSLDEPWATPLAETPLATFLAVDKERTDDAPEAFLSGAIADAQARYNLRNVVGDDGKIVAAELAALQRLCDAAGLSSGVADRLAAAWALANGNDEDAPLLPRSVGQLVWLGLDAQTVRQLSPLLVLLPARTPVNLNTASKEVIAAAAGIDIADAARLVQQRQQAPFKKMEDAKKLLAPSVVLNAAQVATASQFFEVRGQLRMGERILQERALVQRRNPDVLTLQRERVSLNDAGS